MICDGFKVTPLHLPTGRTVWNVSGTVNGTQVRRRFSAKDDAARFRDSQDAILFGRGELKPPVRTHLTEGQVKEAEAVAATLAEKFPGVSLFDLLRLYQALAPAVGDERLDALGAIIDRLKRRHPHHTIAQTIDYYLTHFEGSSSDVKLGDALRDYLIERRREFDSRTLSERQFTAIGQELARLEIHFSPDAPLSSMTAVRLHDFLHGTFPTNASGQPAYSNKSWNNRRGILTTFFNHTVTRGWLSNSPAQRIRVFRRSQTARGEIHTLSAEKAAELMAFAESFQDGRMVPFFALTLFAGIRPDWQDGEISKLTEGNLVLSERYIRLSRDITKTKKKRHTVIQPNLMKWLERYPLNEFPIVCANFKKLIPKVRAKFELKHDGLRHTYCSMLVGKFRSVSETALQAGNSERVLWESYLDLVSGKEAAEFWEILPTK